MGHDEDHWVTLDRRRTTSFVLMAAAVVFLGAVALLMVPASALGG